MSNQAVTDAVKRLNEAAAESAASQAAAVITKIKQLQKCSDESKANESSMVKELNLLQHPSITDVTILGTALPDAASQNVNQQVIAKAISALQKCKLGCVSEKSDRLTQGIAGEQAHQAANSEAIKKLQAELLAITPEVVTESEITGN